MTAFFFLNGLQRVKGGSVSGRFINFPLNVIWTSVGETQDLFPHWSNGKRLLLAHVTEREKKKRGELAIKQHD